MQLMFNEKKLTFADLDECSLGTGNCDSNATCSNTPGSFDCTCNPGYSGNGESCSGKLEFFFIID